MGVFLGFSWPKLEPTSSPIGNACPFLVVYTETLEDENNLPCLSVPNKGLCKAQSGGWKHEQDADIPATAAWH